MAHIQAYHVSGLQHLQEIQPHQCDSRHYDGFLLGAEVASFTTTTYNRELPTISPYPRNAAQYDECFQYSMSFTPADYFKFQMARVDSQVHFLILSRAIASEAAIATFIRCCVPERENLDWDVYFPGGQPNNYSRRGDVFVNVFFFHDVPVDYARTVSRNSARATADAVQGVEWIERLLSHRDEHQALEDEKDLDPLADVLIDIQRLLATHDGRDHGVPDPATKALLDIERLLVTHYGPQAHVGEDFDALADALGTLLNI